MGRFGPGYAVQDRSGEILADAITNAFQSFQQGRQRKRAMQEHDADRQRQQEGEDLTLAMQGLHRGSAPAEAATPMGGGFALGADGRFDLSKMAPVTQAPARYEQLTPGFYRDRVAMDAERKRTAESAAQVEFQKALAKAMGEAQGTPTKYETKELGSGVFTFDPRKGTLGAKLGDRPTAPVRLDTVTLDSGVFNRDPITGALGSRLGNRPPTRDPIADHAATRLFDIQHPLPQQDNGKATEFSNKAALVYPRAAQAAESLAPFFEKGVPATSLLGKATFGQYGVSPEIQRANQAAETISSAILRLESGAAISEHEVKEYAKQFLPQPGDSREVLEQKRQTLQTQLERMRQAASPTMRRDTAPPAAPATQNPWRR